MNHRRQVQREASTAPLIRFASSDCPLGVVLLARSERGICAILLGDEPTGLLTDLQRRFPQAELRSDAAACASALAAVCAFITAPGAAFGPLQALPLDPHGSLFQQRVWQALRQTPPGQTISYRALAERLGIPRAVRAVASACAANPLAIAIPCHRAIRSDGGLADYRWGLKRKRALLAREAAG